MTETTEMRLARILESITNILAFEVEDVRLSDMCFAHRNELRKMLEDMHARPYSEIRKELVEEGLLDEEDA